ncbi:hypothetical protein MTYP_00428 [Methylophilaceae bacterium]|nr:hypothetical protein MTYP_00428 [Methylophilaceae bacterium]
MVFDVQYDDAQDVFLTISRPNASLTVQETACLCSMGAIYLVFISVIFAWAGAWPVPVFGLLVLAALAGDLERLSICGDRVLVEIVEADLWRRYECSAYWTRVVADMMPNGDCRALALCSRGVRIVLGRHLCGDEKRELAHALQKRLGGGFRS